ncbi:hypothetical protein WA538_003722, partial [Blastocystis sp. DL]
THSYAFHRFLLLLIFFNAADLIHLISSLLILITSLYLLSMSINLDSILCSIYPSSLLYPSIPSHSLPIHIQSLLYLFISSVLISLFVIALYFSFPFILISTHPILSLLLCYSLSILQSIFSSFSFHPPSLLYSILIHLLILILSPYSSSTHHSSHSFLSTSSYSISTSLSFSLLPLSSTYNS